MNPLIIPTAVVAILALGFMVSNAYSKGTDLSIKPKPKGLLPGFAPKAKAKPKEPSKPIPTPKPADDPEAKRLDDRRKLLAARIIAADASRAPPSAWIALAQEAHILGLEEAAASCLERARQEAKPSAPKPSPAPAPEEPAPAPSPTPAPAPSPAAIKAPDWLPEATDETWMQYLRAVGSGRTALVSKGGLIGMFLTGARRLGELGVMVNVKKQRHPNPDIKTTIWWGEFAPDYADYLTSAPKQYAVFAKELESLRGTVLARFRSYIGQVKAEKKATLSGLLTLSRQAGLAGMADWLKSDHSVIKRGGKWVPGPEERYPNTTQAYLDTTGVF